MCLSFLQVNVALDPPGCGLELPPDQIKNASMAIPQAKPDQDGQPQGDHGWHEQEHQNVAAVHPRHRRRGNGQQYDDDEPEQRGPHARMPAAFLASCFLVSRSYER